MMETTLPLHAGPYNSLIVIIVKHLASTRTDDGTDDNNLDRSDTHGSSNHDVGKDNHNYDNHRSGGRGHLSKDDTPFSLPFP